MPPLTPYERFWTDWFGLEGREVDDPYQSFYLSSETFIHFVDRCSATRAPCFLSVNPYRTRGRVAGLEKLFFDFDCAEDPGRAFAEAADFARQLDTLRRLILEQKGKLGKWITLNALRALTRI